MSEKVQAEIQQITENYNMGFYTSFGAMMLVYDSLVHAADEIEDEKKREEYRAKIEKAFDTEDMFNAWCNLSLEMVFFLPLNS